MPFFIRFLLRTGVRVRCPHARDHKNDKKGLTRTNGAGRFELLIQIWESTPGMKAPWFADLGAFLFGFSHVLMIVPPLCLGLIFFE